MHIIVHKLIASDYYMFDMNLILITSIYCFDFRYY